MPAKAARRTPSQRLKSFYDEALSEAERADFAAALGVHGIDQEIAVLRLRLRTAIQAQEGGAGAAGAAGVAEAKAGGAAGAAGTEAEADAFGLMVRGIDLLAKALAAKYKLGPGSEEQLQASLRQVLEDMRWLEGGEPNGR